MSGEWRVKRKDLFANHRALVYMVELLKVKKVEVIDSEIHISYIDSDVTHVVTDINVGSN